MRHGLVRRDLPGEQVPQEVALVLGLHRPHGELFGECQRGDRRGALEQVHVVLTERAGAGEGDDPAEVDRPAAIGTTTRLPGSPATVPSPGGRLLGAQPPKGSKAREP